MWTAAPPSSPAAPGLLPRRQLLRARRRSQVVRSLRSIIPGLIFALMAAALFLLVRGAQDGRLSSPSSLTDARILNPRFSGRDSDGRGYTLSAQAAVREGKDGQTIRLDTPRLTRGDRTDDLITVTAPEGEYSEAEKVLVLRGGVVAEGSSGYRFETLTARAEVDSGTVSGNHPISGIGPMGSMRANSYIIREDGAYITLRGQVRSRLHNGKPRA